MDNTNKKDPKEGLNFYQAVFEKVQTILDSEISQREMFAQLCTYLHTAHTYYGQYSMGYMNWDDLDLNPIRVHASQLPKLHND